MTQDTADQDSGVVQDAEVEDVVATEDAGTQPARKTGYKFRSNRQTARPTADEARRQNSVVQSAWRVFGERESAMLFLNSPDEQLGGSPLQVAVKSDEGLSAVERTLAARAAGGTTA